MSDFDTRFSNHTKEILHRYVVNPRHFDVNIYEAGYDAPLPAGHLLGPCVRDYYALEYCFQGRGVLTMGDHDFPIETGQCFVTFPGAVIYEHADDQQPWGLSWLLLKGIRVGHYIYQMGLSAQSPIFPWRDQPAILSQINDIVAAAKRQERTSELELLARAYTLLAACLKLCPVNVSSAKVQKDYVEEAIQYMADNFHKGIHIADVALHLGIDRTYLYTLFKTRVGESPQSYLNNLRVKSACELLQNPYSTLESVAFSLGLEPQTLSRMFKRALGLSPTAYKLRVEQEENKRVGRSAL